MKKPAGKKRPKRTKHVELVKPDKQPEFRDVFIESRAFKTLITSAIEVYNRETNGVILGANTIKAIKDERKKVVTIKEVYPFQTEERKPSEVVHGNVAAFKRVVRTIDSFDAEIIGGYHSHPFPYFKVRLSKGDFISIKEDIDAMMKIGHKRVANEWLEILLSIKRKEYAKPSGREWYICDYMKKLRCYLRTQKRVGWDILVSAYWVYPKRQDPEKVKPLTWEMGAKEAAVFVPWNLD
ncbi:MAG: hypothetical protein V1648_02745 [Candidatus Aenigmatarchaeota archaeon]